MLEYDRWEMKNHLSILFTSGDMFMQETLRLGLVKLPMVTTVCYTDNKHLMQTLMFKTFSRSWIKIHFRLDKVLFIEYADTAVKLFCISYIKQCKLYPFNNIIMEFISSFTKKVLRMPKWHKKAYRYLLFYLLKNQLYILLKYFSQCITYTEVGYFWHVVVSEKENICWYISNFFCSKLF